MTPIHLYWVGGHFMARRAIPILASLCLMTVSACSSVDKSFETDEPSEASSLNQSELLERLRSAEYDHERIALIDELVKRPDEGAPVVPELLRILDESDWPALEESCVNALLQLQVEDRVLERVLVEHLGKCQGVHRRRCLGAFLRISPRDQTTVRAVLEGFDEDSSENKSRRCELLAMIGAPAQSAIPQLRQLLQSPSQKLQHSAALALESLGPLASAAIPDLLHLLAKSQYKGALKRSLKELGRPRERDFNLITFHLKSQSALTRRETMKVIGRLGGDAKKVMTHVLAALEDEDIHVRVEALQIIGEIGPAARSALPRLRELRKSKDYKTLRAVEESLRRIEKNETSKNSVL